jgi:CRP-like cAMP-binding protein
LASKKTQHQIVNTMWLKVYEPNEVMLEAGNMPKDLLFLVSGTIMVFR